METFLSRATYVDLKKISDDGVLGDCGLRGVLRGWVKSVRALDFEGKV